MKELRRAVPSLLTMMTVLVACGNQTAKLDTPKIQIQADQPHFERMITPDSTLVHLNGSQLSAQSTEGELSDEGWVKYTFKNGKSITYRNYDGIAAYGDIAIGKSEDMPAIIRDAEQHIEDDREGSALEGQSVGLNPQGCSAYFFWCTFSTYNYMWPYREIDYQYRPGFTTDQMDQMDQQIQQWNSKNTHIKFRKLQPGSTQSYPINIYPTNVTDYCGLARVGYQSNKPADFENWIRININPGSNFQCWKESTGTIQHELGHVIGLPHEQDRCDYATFVTLGYDSNGNLLSNNPKCGSDFKYYGKFDYSSIMLYQSPYVYGKSPEPVGKYQGTYSVSIPRIFQLSPGDIETINGMYP